MKKNGIIGKKIGMTRIFTEDGQSIPVTALYIVNQTVVEKKCQEKDGYNSIKVAYEETKESKINKPTRGILKKAGVEKNYRKFIEFKGDYVDSFEPNTDLTIDLFDNVKKVSVVGISKGRGFASAIKRHNFQRGPSGHGSKNVRLLGSIGQCSYPANVFKGKKMPGQYGNRQVTIKNLQVVDVLKEDNLLLVKGSVPGPNGQNLIITIG